MGKTRKHEKIRHASDIAGAGAHQKLYFREAAFNNNLKPEKSYVHNTTLFSNTKELPADAEVISHKLMLRAGMIVVCLWHLYLTSIGLRVLRKVRKNCSRRNEPRRWARDSDACHFQTS